MEPLELRMNPYQLPDKVTFNFEELKTGIAETLKTYEVTIYSDDQIKQAKVDRAKLNALKNALNDERIRREKEYLKPFNEFKAQVNEIITMIDKPVQAINKQVREYEDQKKKEKLEQIKEYWQAQEKPFDIEFERIMDARWGNASESMTKIKKYIDSRLAWIRSDVTTILNLSAFAFEALEVYKSTLDLYAALFEAQKLEAYAEKKQTAAAKQQEEQLPGQIGFTDHKSFEECMNPLEQEEKKPEMEWVAFRALMTTEEALALKNFFQMRDIRFEAIRG